MALLVAVVAEVTFRSCIGRTKSGFPPSGTTQCCVPLESVRHVRRPQLNRENNHTQKKSTPHQPPFFSHHDTHL